MSDEFDGVTPDMIRAADRGAAPKAVDVPADEVADAPVVKARKQTTR